MARRMFKVALAVTLLSQAPLVAASQLLEVYDQALQHDPDYAAAEAALRADKEAYPQARAAALPTLQATGSYTDIDRKVKQTPFSNSPGASSGNLPSAPFSDEFTSTNYGVELRQPIFDWSIPAQLRQAEAQVTRARVQFGIVQKQLISRSARAYLIFLRAASQLNLVQSESRALAEDLKQAKARYEVGETGVTGLREAQAAHDLVSARTIDAQTALDNAREELNNLTERWYEKLDGMRAQFPLTLPDPSDPDTWVKIALNYNGAYLLAQRDVKIAREQITNRQGQYLPKIDVVASYTDLDSSEFVFGSASADKAIGLEATWQLFSGGRTSSQLREARARYDASTSRLESTRRGVRREIRNAYRAIEQSVKRVRAQSRVIVSSQAALKATSAGFDVGERTQADVLNARRDLFQARIEHTNARYDYLLASLNLKFLSGIIDRRDLHDVGLLLDGAPLPQPAAAKDNKPKQQQATAAVQRFSLPPPSVTGNKE